MARRLEPSAWETAGGGDRIGGSGGARESREACLRHKEVDGKREGVARVSLAGVIGVQRAVRAVQQRQQRECSRHCT
jgi:hypothetical protein